ncbi:L,D-transpeptidase [Hyphomicrobium sp.]|jgi:lipoprotein-anchoring transpeptidase ErfK/SrfK|uniref:L,D-transpeptidase n=1 Tax=Hyphomicrobium sp. TaxID=82 RepID=UPI002BA076AF|nr:L,D-transpeptidase [Hyphomicrobium sp.]HVZ04493.1 L,D-transpeptidase [Hyphomicrobium sp.]
MLRAASLVALSFAVFTALPAAAKPVGSNDKVAAATETSSGTTTYFGSEKAKSQAPIVVAAKSKAKPLRPTLTAAVDLTNQRMIVKVGGETRYSWPISSGVAQYPTPTGSFMPQRTEKMWYSRKYDMSPMPHAVFIHGGVAIHGTSYVSSIGRPASHGCIRLSKANAATFYNLVKRHGITRTRVTVYGRPHWRGGSEIARRDNDRRARYADSQGSWFWGDSWGDDDSAYERRRPRQGYVYRGGQPVKVYRKRNGDYVYRRVAPSRYYDYADD